VISCFGLSADALCLVLFAEHNTYGPGVPKDPQRANYTTLLTTSVWLTLLSGMGRLTDGMQEARMYNVSSTLGVDWETWVDHTYYWP
jgi:pectinesterase